MNTRSTSLSSPSFRIRSRICRRSGVAAVSRSPRTKGLWTAADAHRQISARTADVYCFSPYFTGSLAQFQKLSWLAHLEGLQICRHTHGELGITAAACHHILLTLPNVIDGNQQTAHVMTDDIVVDTIPITHGPDWGVPSGVGIGVEVDEEKIGKIPRALQTPRAVRAL